MNRHVSHIIIFILLSYVSVPLYSKKKAVSRDSKLNHQGLQFLNTKKYRKAVVCFFRAVKLNSSNKYYYNNLAVALMKLKRYNRAQIFLQKAISLDASYVKALSNMSIVCFYLGQYKQAYAYYKRVQKADRSYSNARFARDKVLRKLRYLSKKNPDNTAYKKMLRYLEKKSR